VSNARIQQSNHGQLAAQELPLLGVRVQASAWADWIPSLFVPRQFITLTSRDAVSDGTLCRRYGFIVQQVNRNLFGNNWRRQGVGISHVYAVEPQQRGVPHIHAVWDAEFVPYDLIHSIAKRISGYAWIEPVSSSSGVGHYVTKYAVKSGQVFVYLSRHKQALGQSGL
jgi:hypothetical protein